MLRTTDSRKNRIMTNSLDLATFQSNPWPGLSNAGYRVVQYLARTGYLLHTHPTSYKQKFQKFTKQ